ncbi:MAG: DNA repair protein RadC [Chitinophagales bacterium]|nr:DNA repair protein RadC [Chitinophagales bacterium]
MTINDAEKLSIKYWAEEDRPREKLILKGRRSLSNAELLAIIIGSGSKQFSALDIAKQILNSVDNNLYALSKFSAKDLEQFKGIGEAKAINIVAAFEIAFRMSQSQVTQTTQIVSSKQVFQLMNHLSLLPHEEFWIVLLNNRNELLNTVMISKGGQNRTLVDAKIIFNTAIKQSAAKIILVHNHPSGNNQPSHEDKKLTQNLIEASTMLDLPIIDHIIIAQKEFYSFKDNSLLF